MSRKRRIFLSAIFVLCCAILAGTIGLGVLQSTWSKGWLKGQITSTVERVSGGRVEIGAINYDWRTLAFQLHNFTIHGTEPSNAPPLFQADVIGVRLTIVSLLERKVNINRLQVIRPHIHLTFQKSGASNLPSPIHARVLDANLAEQLIRLHVQRYELRNGTFDLNLQRFPLNVLGENLMAQLVYNRAAIYAVQLSSQETAGWPTALANKAVDFAVQARLEKDRIVFQKVSVHSAESSLQASGSLDNFADPAAVFHVSADMAATEFAQILRTPELRGGRVAVRGEGRYDPANSLRFAGDIHASNVAYSSSGIALTNVQFESAMEANAKGAELSRLKLQLLGGTLTGHLSTDYRQFQLAGEVHRIGVRDLLAPALHRRSFWAASIDGPVDVRGAITNGHAEDVVVASALQISPGRDGAALSGQVAGSYQQEGNVLTIKSSDFKFAGTEIAAAGTPGQTLHVDITSSDIQDLPPALASFNVQLPSSLTSCLPKGGRSQFQGTITGRLQNPRLTGNLVLSDFSYQGGRWNKLVSQVDLSSTDVQLYSFALDGAALRAKGNLKAALQNWRLRPGSPVSLQAQFASASPANLALHYLHWQPDIAMERVSGAVDIGGPVDDPRGKLDLTVDNADAYGQHLERTQLAATLGNNVVAVTDGVIDSGPARVTFSATYHHDGNWENGELTLRGSTNRFPISSISAIRSRRNAIDGLAQTHFMINGSIDHEHFLLGGLNGVAGFRRLVRDRTPIGDLMIQADTRGRTVTSNITGILQQAPVNGSVQMQLTKDLPAHGSVTVGHLSFDTIRLFFDPAQIAAFSSPGYLEGNVAFEGPLRDPSRIRVNADISRLRITPPDNVTPASFFLQNERPIRINAAAGIASIADLQLAGPNTKLSVAGSFPYVPDRPIDLRVGGSVNLALIKLLNPAVQSSGECQISATVQGSLRQPKMDGLLQIRRGMVFPNNNNLPDGLSGITGTIKFDDNRATIERLTARSGGGQVAMSGFVSFSNNAPVLYRLEARASDVRVRYVGGVSITANSALRLTGTNVNSLLAGTITVTKVSFNPNTDLGSLLAASAKPAITPVNEKNFASGLQMDIRIESAVNMQVNTSLSQDIEAEADLQLRGRPSTLSLLGSISANQGTVKVFGASYTINRGEIRFNNPMRIEPTLDLDLQTQARGISVDITVSGTPGKLNINYRSDPPLQPRDILALLTVGRAPDVASNVPNAQLTNDASALQYGANTVLGQAFAPVSNRLSKLFGITNIKIDPLVQGITNTPQARLTLQQQISRDISVTYVTNLSQTSEQIFRFEWALNRQYSIIALRDDNGEFGIDIQFRKLFK